MIVPLPQDHLHGPSGPAVDRHRTAQVHRAVPHRVPHYAQGVEAQLLALSRLQGLQLSPGEDRSVTGIQREGIHSHEGQAGGDGALEAEQGPLAALEGQEIERLLLLEAEQSLREMEIVLLLTLDLAEILRL